MTKHLGIRKTIQLSPVLTARLKKALDFRMKSIENNVTETQDRGRNTLFTFKHTYYLTAEVDS